VAALR